MPTYQYACTSCGEQLEVVQSFSDAALTECPECQGKLRKLFSGVGIVFKGSGFYRTDSRSGSAGSAAAKESGSDKSGSKESGSKESGSEKSGSKESGGAKESGAAKDSGTKSDSGAKKESSAKPAVTSAT